MKKHIPNFITSLNLFCGCLSASFAFRGVQYLEVASYFILLAALFDFFDGFAARLLKVESIIGKDLDSFADNISFGFAPAAILFVWLKYCLGTFPPEMQSGILSLLPYVAFVVTILAAVRLAKFNHDERQKTEFRGLATPANALFVGFIHFAADKFPIVTKFWVVIAFALAFALLQVSDIPMFSFKMKSLKFKENYMQYSFLMVSILLFIFFQFGAMPLIILVYILFSFTKYLFKI